ncbi:hypothetical protein [Spirosoma lituiforme]
MMANSSRRNKKLSDDDPLQDHFDIQKTVQQYFKNNVNRPLRLRPNPYKPTEAELTEAQNVREENLKKAEAKLENERLRLEEAVQKERLSIEEEKSKLKTERRSLAQIKSAYKAKIKQLGLDEFGENIPEVVVKAVRRAVIETPLDRPAKFHVHDESIVEMKKHDNEAGYRLVVFKHTYTDLMEAIAHDEVIKHAIEGDFNLREELQNPKFRFISVQAPRLSRLAADALSAQTQYTKTLYGRELSKKGAEKRNIDADQYAVNMYDLISRLKKKENISSYRDTVKALNANNIPTFREGGEWHLSTLQNLQKRWKELNLISAKSKSSKKPKP